MSDPVFVSAFGHSVALDPGPGGFLGADSLWRLREIYEPALAREALPDSGLAVDIGAGFGAFALPFALAFPGWQIRCFEPEEESYAALCRNIDRLGLRGRVQATRAAIVPGARGGRALLRGDREKPGFLAADLPEWQGTGPAQSLPALPPAHVAALTPTLVKFTCPGQEAGLLGALQAAPPRWLIGESWQPVPSTLLAPETRAYVPLAGTPFRLQQGPASGGLRPGLDVVVAMYNSAATIRACVASTLTAGRDDIRALVVDDGSTDSGAEEVRRAFGDDPRVVLLQKVNGGCASARNHGRMASDAAHLAFVDADDTVDPDFFANLLELARYSGAPIVQGSFAPFEDTPHGRLFAEPPEAAAHAGFPRQPFGSAQWYPLPWEAAVTGQPSIWRRVYRRDFLDARDIWFPEHIRAFDDLLFQLVSCQHAGMIPTREDLRYHYRQHAAQDIRAGDERMIYSLEMYRLVLRRAVEEGWPRFDPFAVSFFNTLHWTLETIRPDLAEPFLQGAAELWVLMRKVFGRALDPVDRSVSLPVAFARQRRETEARLAGFADSYAFAYLDSAALHVDMVRASA
ncbi:glycosyltransferase [Pseudooceanicola sp. CBS1P-1]|uniref:Glycosyltransferase n=1 Tax=Pseudooceanicola albus TaxID=2692189 RepID=A0A6L7GCM6_9RHOB|nr:MULTISPECIES: glycosyltransferase [Pseudooceanicola]MBT9386520.1 glycosyltransferase [Pseudooceanicola endophyticus]MXN20553.1 glycosyltransferase [Pseudooceanicola albus]